MNHIGKFFFSIIISLSSLGSVSAYDFEDNGIFYNITSSSEMEIGVTYDIQNKSSYTGKIIIPQKVRFEEKEYIVSSILSETFAGSEVTKVLIPNTIKTIGNYAFSNCINLENIEGLENVSEIGNHTFEYCSNLKEVQLSDNLKKIGDYCFNHCSKLENFDFPDSITEIGEGAFCGCPFIEINLPESLEVIKRYAFQGCYNVKKIKIPNSLQTIERFAFDIRESYIYSEDEQVRVYIEDLESWCNINFTENYSNPLEKGGRLFLKDEEIINLYIPENITTIKACSFLGCSSIEAINFNEQVTTIDFLAFAYLKNLTSLIIPKNIKEIWPNVFMGCDNLKKVIFEDGEEILRLRYWTVDADILSFADSPLEDLYLGRNLDFPATKYYGYSPFYNNDKIKNLSIGKYVRDATSIYPKKFEDTINSIYCYNPNPPKMREFSNYEYMSVQVNIPISSLTNFQDNEIWSNFWNINENLPNPNIILAEKIILNKEYAEMNVGENLQLEANVLPENATDTSLIWISSNEDIATVSQTGYVTALEVGQVEITASCSLCTATCLVNITDPTIYPEGIQILNKQETVKFWEELKLEVEITPEDAENKTVAWTSSNEEVATVDEDGNLSFHSYGNTTISATSHNNLSDSFNLTVLPMISGDANGNDEVTVADAVVTANYAMGIEVDRFYYIAADVNKDDNITIADATGIVTIILESPAPVTEDLTRAHINESNGYLKAEDFLASTGQSTDVNFSLVSPQDFVALQADVKMPEGMTLNSISVAPELKSHSVSFRNIDSNTVRIVVFSTGNKSLLTESQNLFTINASVKSIVTKPIGIGNVIASDSSAIDYSLEGVDGYNTNTTSIDDMQSNLTTVISAQGTIIVKNAMDSLVDIYSLDGKLVKSAVAESDNETYPLIQGTYLVIVNGESFKTIIR